MTSYQYKNFQSGKDNQIEAYNTLKSKNTKSKNSGGLTTLFFVALFISLLTIYGLILTNPVVYRFFSVYMGL